MPSQIFDPLGWVTLVTIKAKILQQETWQTKFVWDKPLPSTIKDKWIAILANLEELPQLMIPRVYFLSVRSSVDMHNTLVFADTSTKAYGAVVYLTKDD